MKMSQKISTKNKTLKVNDKPNTTTKTTTAQAQSSDVKKTQQKSVSSNKSVKTSKIDAKPPVRQIQSNDVKKNENKGDVKVTVNKKQISNNIKTQNKTNVSIKKKDENIRKDVKVVKNNVKVTKDNRESVNKDIRQTIDTKNNKIETKIVPKQLITNQTEIKQPEKVLVESSIEGNNRELALVNLDTNSFLKLHGTSSESILAEPPSICESERNHIINDISDDQNDDYQSYCDDFDEYESDFEDDIEEENEINSEKSDQELSESETSDKHSNDIIHENEEKDKIDSCEMTNSNSVNISDGIVKEIDSKLGSSFQNIKDIKSAHSRSESVLNRNKANKRSNELLEIIKLNKMHFNNFEFPPISYDIFIRIFGKKNTKQVSCQTSERTDIEIQTDCLLTSNKWTQNPSFTRINAGNDEEDCKILINEPNIDPFKLTKFLNKAQTILSAIIDNEFEQKSRTSIPTGAEQFSKSFSVLKCLSLAKKCPISYIFTNTLYLFCIQNVSKIMGSTEKSVIVVWNLLSRKQPELILICRSHIVKAYSEDNIVIAVMIDGSVAVWDLKDECNYQKEVIIDNNIFSLRSPSYNSAVTGLQHNNVVIGITKLYDNQSNDGSFNFATIDQTGILTIWAIVQAKGDGNDLGVLPTSNCRLSRISVINILKELDLEDENKITAFDCQPNDWTQIYCGTDNGSVIRCPIHKQLINDLPKSYKSSEMSRAWNSVTKIVFSKSEPKSFLVGYRDGFVCYYSITNENALIVIETNDWPIIEINWVSDCCSSFIAINSKNETYIFDSVNEDIKLISSYKHQSEKLLSMSIWKGMDIFLVFGCESGDTLVFSMKNKLEIG